MLLWRSFGERCFLGDSPGVSSRARVVKAVQLDLAFSRDSFGKTYLSGRRVRYPFVALRPFWFGDLPKGLASLFLQSGSGGLYDGERLAQRFVVEVGAAAHVTTQAAVPVHEAKHLGGVRQSLQFELRGDAYFEHISDPLILFPGSQISQLVQASVGPNSIMVYGEGFLAYNPDGVDGIFHSLEQTVDCRTNTGKLLFRDSLSVTGASFVNAASSRGDFWAAMGTVVAVAPDEVGDHANWCAAVQARLDAVTASAEGKIYAASDYLPNASGVICRIVAIDGAYLRLAFEAAWRELRLAITGAPAPRSRK